MLVLQAIQKLGLWGLFTRGLPLRIVMIGTLTGAQWVIYDAFKVSVGLYVSFLPLLFIIYNPKYTLFILQISIHLVITISKIDTLFLDK